MELPAYWLRRPGAGPDPRTVAEFDALLGRMLAAGPRAPVDYRLAAPKWQFLCHVAERGDIVLHGSGNPDIELFEPRQSDDIAEFGNRAAVYAAADGIWPMYFAILDRPRHRMSLTNSCMRVERPDGSLSEPYYFFSVNQEVHEEGQFSTGTVYLLPAEGFEREAPYDEGGRRVHTAQRASLRPVAPLAGLRVAPADFPLPIRAHHHATQVTRVAADPGGFPWVDEG